MSDESKASYLVGRIHNLLEKQIAYNAKGIAMLEQKRERLQAGGVWHQKEDTVESISTVLEYRLKDQLELVTLLDLICQQFGICSEQPKQSAEEKKLMEFIESKPALLEKIKNMMEQSQKEATPNV